MRIHRFILTLLVSVAAFNCNAETSEDPSISVEAASSIFRSGPVDCYQASAEGGVVTANRPFLASIEKALVVATEDTGPILAPGMFFQVKASRAPYGSEPFAVTNATKQENSDSCPTYDYSFELVCKCGVTRPNTKCEVLLSCPKEESEITIH